ncbi:Cytochrome c7 c [uncultured archaeon]|nr:Cytochrome c7 c [uncultured archaeon]
MRKILLFITIAVFLGLLIIINLEHPEQTVPGKPEDTTTREKYVSNFTVLVSKDVCEGCHMSGKSYVPQALSVIPHINGGAYCLSCHKISHETHPINKNVTCEKCHGTTPTVPAYVNGSIPCNNCHAYPDPLLPSKGNLIAIHLPRGITCNTCHTNECTTCHSEMGKSERWDKRLTHFRAILNKPVS